MSKMNRQGCGRMPCRKDLQYVTEKNHGKPDKIGKRNREDSRNRVAAHTKIGGGICTAEMHRIFWLENLKGRDHSEDLNADGTIISEWILGK
jgi:hypothetical protein